MSNVFDMQTGGSYSKQNPPIDPPSGGGHDGGMDDVIFRIGRLEGDMKEVKSDMKGLVKDVAELKGRLANMPTTFQMATWFVSVAIGLCGLIFAIAKLTH